MSGSGKSRDFGGDEQLGSNSMSGLSKPSAECGYFRIAMNSGLAKALGVMMKWTPQIANGLAALSIEQLQHRIIELAVKPDGMLHPIHLLLSAFVRNLAPLSTICMTLA